MSEQYVVGIGGANIDMMGRSRRALVPEDSNPGRICMSVGGVTHNICDNVARLGIPVKLITAVGDDIYADKIQKECIDVGIDTSHFLKVPNHASSAYISIHDNNGEMAVAVSDMSVLQHMTVDFIKTKHSVLRNAGAIVTDPNVPKAILDYVSRTYGKYVPIFVDPVSTTYAEKLCDDLSNYYLIKPNIYEMKTISGIKTDTKAGVIEACRAVLDRGVKRVVVTRGHKGSVYADGSGQVLSVKGEEITDIANATGGGDAFMGGLIYGTMKNLNDLDMLKFATAASQLAIRCEETINPAVSEQTVWDTVEQNKIKIEKIMR